MRRMVEKILTCYGREMTIHRAGKTFPVRGFLQPVTGTAKQMAQMEASPLGMVPQGRYTYLGPLEPGLQVGDLVAVEERVWVVRQAQDISGAYTWAMCAEKGCEDTWGVNG